MSNLLDGIESFAESWRPVPGDKIAGIVTDVDSRESEYGAYPIIVLEVSEGTEAGYEIDAGEERAIHAFRTVLRNEVDRKRPQVGDEMAVFYGGQPDGKDYHLYRLKLRRNTAPPPANEGTTLAELDGEPVDDPQRSGRDREGFNTNSEAKGKTLTERANPELGEKVKKRGKPLMAVDDSDVPF